MGWFGSVLHDAIDPGGLLSGAESRVGGWLDDGAHVVGGALSDVGLRSAGQWVDRAGDDVANYLGAQIPEEQLGQTTDPAELVHGDPGALRVTASRLQEFASAFGETASGLADIDTGHWTGAAADAFRTKYAPEPGRWRDAATASAGAADALESYAGTVQWAQGQARQAIELYAEGQRATAAATSAYNNQVAAYNQAAQAYDSALAAGRNPGARPVQPGPFTDPGTALRERAQQILAAARQRLAGALPLVVARAHRSSYRAGRWFGRTWASTLDQRLEVREQGVFYAAPDSVVLCYPHPGDDGKLVLPVAGARWPLARVADGGYTVTDPQGGIVWRFESRSGFYVSAAGHGELPLVSVTDPAGHQVTIGYGLDGTPQSVALAGSYQVKVTTAGGRVTGLDLAGAGRDGTDVPLVRYRYDDAANLSEVVDSSGSPQRLSYDADGRLTGWEDRNGWTYRYSYDAQGRCVRGEGPNGALSGTFCYDPDSRVTTHTDAAGAVTVYQLTERRGDRPAEPGDPQRARPVRPAGVPDRPAGPDHALVLR